MPARNPASSRSPARSKLNLGSKPGKRRKFIVSLAGPGGGGRQEIYATSAKDAANIAAVNAFGRVKVPGGTEAIVTDTTKKRNSQQFFSVSRARTITGTARKR